MARRSDAELVEAAREGSGEAFGELMARYRDAVFGVAFHRLGDFEEARDVVQEAFVKAYLSLDALRDPSAFARWLYRIADGTALDAARRPRREVPLTGEELAPDRTEEAERAREVREVISRLSEPARLAVVLHYVDGYSHAEVANFLGTTSSAVKMRLSRARRRLREELTEMVGERIRAAAREGRIVFRRTTLDELKALLGPPVRESAEAEGLLERIRLTYPGVEMVFVRDSGRTTSPIVLWVTTGNEGVDIGRGRLVALRDRQDLERLDSFWGAQGMSLAALDLRNEAELLARVPFNSDTRWPPGSQLPPGFDPQALLEQGKNPGLGVRGLHARGLDGRGIGLAIIDQPLVRDHREYAGRIARYEELDVEGVSPQMHGPAVASIAVGKTCGVAPGAALHYYAMPMWSWQSCEPYREVIERILARNRGATGDQRLRVVSISTGMFSQWEGYAEWRRTLAEAAAQGVLVTTCDGDWLRYGTLLRKEGADPDDPAGYDPTVYMRAWSGGSQVALWVPAGNRTIAGWEHPEAYTYDRTGGHSWAAPYLAGLAALAFQVKPELDPTTIIRLWQETATKTEVGPIVNPTAFLSAVRTAG